MTTPALGQPFYTPNQIVRDAAGRTYMPNQQGQLVPVTVTPVASPGDPSQPQVQNAPAAPSWGQPASPAPQPQQQQQAQMSDDTILNGPSVPPELRGRTFGQVKQLYAAMAQQAAAAARQPQQPQAQPVQQQPQQQQPQQPNGQRQPMDAREFYTNPEANTRRIVEETLRSTLEPMLRPMIQQTASSAAANARDSFLASNPAAAQYMPEMLPMLERSSPEQLADPRTWDAIYNYVLGSKVRLAEANRSQGYNPAPQQQPQFQQPVRSSMMGDFFTEASTPSPQSLNAPPAAGNLTSWELGIAAASGMTPQQYAQSKADLAAGRFPQFGMPVGGQNGR